MLEFPKLKSGERVQYPLLRGVEAPVRRMEFLDGTAQRYALRRPRRHWRVRLAELDEGEAGRVDEFLREYLTGFEEFAFTDPVTGVVCEHCRLELDEKSVEAAGPYGCGVELKIVEVMR